MTDPTQTSLTLLGRLAADENEAWGTFRRLYTPLIYAWCRKAFGIREDHAEDICQEVFLKVRRSLMENKGPQKGKFRAWLKTVTKRTCQDNRIPFPAVGGEDNVDRIASLEGGPANWEEDVEMAIPERIVILQTAVRALSREPEQDSGKRGRKPGPICSPRDVQIFIDVARGADRQALADELNLTKNAIYVATSRVKTRLTEVFGEILDADLLPAESEEGIKND